MWKELLPPGLLRALREDTPRAETHALSAGRVARPNWVAENVTVVPHLQIMLEIYSLSLELVAYPPSRVLESPVYGEVKSCWKRQRKLLTTMQVPSSGWHFRELTGSPGLVGDHADTGWRRLFILQCLSGVLTDKT